MNKEILACEIENNYPFTPNPEQEKAIGLLSVFVSGHGESDVFLLKGYAGTGKTTLAAVLVRTLLRRGVRFVLMAPTGRAAKVFSSYSGLEACTVHKKIYRQKSILESSTFQLDYNYHEHTLFIVDEASMISNDVPTGSTFGSGRLLDDLIRYVFRGKNCRLLLMGDDAQLPPVGELSSPALSKEILAGYGLGVIEFSMESVMRQMRESGILYNATRLRGYTANSFHTQSFRFKLHGFKDVISISGNELIETLATCYNRDGIDETMVLCRSNKRASTYNNGIRNTILEREEELSRGDSVMIVRNNYYWIENMLEIGDRESYERLPSFIANGDIATIRRVRRQRELYGFRFEDAVLSFPDYDDMELEVTLLLDTLHCDSASLAHEDSDRLFNSVMEDYMDIPSAKERMKKIRKNPYFNALQIKYAYAVTCHKAQGGQWRNIFIDQGYLPDDGDNEEYYRWLYTALTRATQTVYLVNWPDKQIER